LTDVNLQLRDGAAQSIAVHTKLARGAALVSFVFLKYRQDKALLEFAHRLRVQNIAFVHLHNQGFQLISHGISLSRKSGVTTLPHVPISSLGTPPNRWRTALQLSLFVPQ
jgi:hypothetical protein